MKPLGCVAITFAQSDLISIRRNSDIRDVIMAASVSTENVAFDLVMGKMPIRDHDSITVSVISEVTDTANATIGIAKYPHIIRYNCVKVKISSVNPASNTYLLVHN